MSTEPHLKAYLIGISRYEDPNINQLKNPVNDVNHISEILEAHYGYETKVLKDKEATQKELRKLFEDLTKTIVEEDRVIFYFAGHGHVEDPSSEERRAYLSPYDAIQGKCETYLPMTEFKEALKKLQCRHLLVLLDSCHGGAFVWSNNTTRASAGRRQRKEYYRETYEYELKQPAKQVITSAAASQTAKDKAGGTMVGLKGRGDIHSPFAWALIKALKDDEADSDKNGVTTAEELYRYIQDKLKQEYGDKQRPVNSEFGESGQAGNFLFTKKGTVARLPFLPKLSPKNNPYRGLNSYEKKDAPLFFGRAQLTKELADKVAKQPLTLVVGESGSGKSSLVKAGLVGHLQEQKGRWEILEPVRPGKSPMGALKDAARALEARRGAGGAEAPPRAGALPALAEAARGFKARQPDMKMLLIVDQLEELVTMASGGEERARFFAALEEACEAGLRVVCTLRADFEPHFREITKDRNARFPVVSMSREELREVIVRPAEEHMLEFEPPSLVDELIDEVHNSPGALPLLSFTLSELYREWIGRDATDRTLTKADYDRLGGVNGALGKRADAIYNNQPDEAQKRTMERVLLRLVSDTGGELAKRRVPMRELDCADATETRRSKVIVDQLVEARLVVKGREDEGTQPGSARADREDARTYVEAAHDKLITGWPKLSEILAKHGDELRLLRACTEAAELWDEKRDVNLLWDSNFRLPLLMDLQKRDPLKLSRLEADFIKQSWWRRIMRRIALGAIIVVVMALMVMVKQVIDETNRAKDAAIKKVTDETNRAKDAAIKKAQRAQQVRVVRAMFRSLDVHLKGSAGSVRLGPAPSDASGADSGAWTSISRVPDSLPNGAQSPSGSRDFVAVRDFGDGHVMVIAHDGLLADENIEKGSGGLVFAENAFRWLGVTDRREYGRVGTIRLWKGSFFSLDKFRQVAAMMKERHWAFEVARPDRLEDDLRDASVLWYATDWDPPKDFASHHVPIIKRFVEKGGGLLIAGLGWSHRKYGPPGGYAANDLGRVFGVEFTLDEFAIDPNKPFPVRPGDD